MNFWQFLGKQMPLNDIPDVYARIGARFVWCTGPYLVFALTLSAFGNNRVIQCWGTYFACLIPLVGGIIDSWRLRRLGKTSTSTRHGG